MRVENDQTMNLHEIKNSIIKFVESGENVDHVIDIVTSNLSEDQKIHLTELFEIDMINRVNESNNLFDANLSGSLKKILNSTTPNSGKEIKPNSETPKHNHNCDIIDSDLFNGEYAQ